MFDIIYQRTLKIAYFLLENVNILPYFMNVIMDAIT